MGTILEIVFPLFALVACGYLAGSLRLVNEAGIDGITNFVFYVAVPVLLFRSLGRSELPDLEALNVIYAYFGGVFSVFILACLIGRFVFSLPIEQQAIMGMGSSYSNTVFFGIPIVYTVYGEEAILPLLLIITFNGLILYPLIIFIICLGRGERGWERLKSAGKSMLRNPIVISVVAGVIWLLSGLELPKPVDAFAGFLSGATAPAALFALGASLTVYKVAGNISESLVIVFLKLFVHPLAVWYLASFVFSLPPLWVTALTITAAVPSGANVYLTAQFYGTYVARAASVILIGTLISMGTISALLTVLLAQG